MTVVSKLHSITVLHFDNCYYYIIFIHLYHYYDDDFYTPVWKTVVLCYAPGRPSVRL